MTCRLNARSMCYPAWWTSALELRRLRSRPARSKLRFNLAGWGPNLYLDPNWKGPGRRSPALGRHVTSQVRQASPPRPRTRQCLGRYPRRARPERGAREDPSRDRPYRGGAASDRSCPERAMSPSEDGPRIRACRCQCSGTSHRAVLPPIPCRPGSHPAEDRGCRRSPPNASMSPPPRVREVPSDDYSQLFPYSLSFVGPTSFVASFRLDQQEAYLDRLSVAFSGFVIAIAAQLPRIPIASANIAALISLGSSSGFTWDRCRAAGLHVREG